MNLPRFEALLFKSIAAGFVALVAIAGAGQLQPRPTETARLEPVVGTAASVADKG